MAYGTACMIECSLAQVRNICTVLIKNARLKSTNHAVFMLQASYFLLEYRPRRSVVIQAHMKLYKPKDLGSFFCETSFTLFNINKSSRAHEFTSGFLVGSMLLIFSVFCAVLLRILTFLVPCCDVRYHFRIETMFGSSLSPVVCKRVRVFFMFVYVSWCVLGIVLVFVMCIVYPMLPFSLDCPFFVMTVWCSLMFMHSPCIMGISIFYN